jgi:hypothetical protein
LIGKRQRGSFRECRFSQHTCPTIWKHAFFCDHHRQVMAAS